MKRKLLGLILTVSMLATLIPTTVYAEESNTNDTETVVYTDANDDPLNDRTEGNIDSGFFGDDENAGISTLSLYDAGYSQDRKSVV